MTEKSKILDETVTGIVRKHLGPAWESSPIPEEGDLFALGIDSMKSISLLLDLEGAFGIVFADDMLAPENYRTLRSLKTMVGSAL